MRSLARWVLGVLVAVALLAPFLANDVPLVASVDGELHFPAAHTVFGGDPPPAPDRSDWKTWWALLPGDGDDWALMPPWPYGPYEVEVDRIRAGPDLEHPLGSDDVGRDVLARIVHGTTTALGIGLTATLLALAAGVLVGGAAGYWGGWIDTAAGRLVELFLCFPAVFLVLAAGAFFGHSALLLIAVLALVQWPSFARLLRGELLSLRQRDYVAAARGLGVPGRRILLRHLLPQARGPLAVNAAFAVAQCVAIETTLSFLGLGLGSRAVSWGRMLDSGREIAHAGGWHLWLFPTVMIVITIAVLHGAVDRRPARADE